MFALEQLLVEFLSRIIDPELITQFFRDPRTTARIVGVLVAVSGALLGSFLVLRGAALTSDAISHTVLLGIVVAFLVLQWLGGDAPSLSNGWLLVGAAFAGVVTVLATELLHRAGLMREDAALGLVFPLLFSLAIILIAGYSDGAHLDGDAVMVGEIGVAWANTNSHCLSGCETVEITREDPRAQTTQRCTNCVRDGVSPRDPAARFVEVCTNCGVYAPAAAYRAGLTSQRPRLVFWPHSVTATLVAMIGCILFVTALYKELKLSTFDPALAAALGFRPGLIHALLMTAVSVVAVTAFDAVGSILVIAFFIIPAATANLLTERLSWMLVLSVIFGAAAAWWGYDLARGRLFGVIPLPGSWDTSISASMVVLMLGFFLVVLLVSPRHGLIAGAIRRSTDRARFEELVVLGHIANHGSLDAARRSTTPERGARTVLGWPEARLQRAFARLRSQGYLTSGSSSSSSAASVSAGTAPAVTADGLRALASVRGPMNDRPPSRSDRESDLRTDR